MATMREEVVARYLAGEKVKDISLAMDVSTTSVYWNLDKAGVRRRQLSGPRKVTPEQAEQLRDEYLAGESTRSLAAKYGLGLKTVVQNIRQVNGGQLRRQGDAPKHWSSIRTERQTIIERHGEEIARRYSTTGESQQAIADSLGISQAIVSRAIAKAGVSKRHPTMSDHHSWTGGKVNASSGYVAVMPLPDDPIGQAMLPAGGGFYVLEHRLVMAHSLGRPLAKEETVHHINGDRQDNRIENLQLRQGKHGKGIVARCGDCGSHNVISSPITEVGEMSAALHPSKALRS
jgi:transposase-like protein